jgi:hypothetical protein
MKSRSSLPLLGLGSLLLLTAGACGQILGLDSFKEGSTGTGGGTTGTGGATTGTGGSSSTGGMTGTGGTGGNPPITCSPGEVKACPYKGPGATENKGVCKAGTQTCLPNGSGFGECTGEVQPTPENCATPEDEDCDGVSNQASAGCVCVPKATETCYEGDPATAHMGACKDGVHVCDDDGKGWGPCNNQVLPTAESCATQEDDNCDGQANEGCACSPGTMTTCYTGDPATKDQGLCHGGNWTCDLDGLGYGACMNQQLPAGSDDCTNAVDEDCTGNYCTEAVWTKSYPGTSFVSDMVADAAGNTYVTGFFSGSLPIKNPPLTASGGIDGFAAKLDPTGATVWAIQFGDVNNQFGRGIALDSMGNVILTGYFRNGVTFGATTLGGATNDSDQIFVAKLDNNGNTLWAHQYGDAPNASIANQQGSAVAVDPSDNIIFVGQFANKLDLGNGSPTLVKGNTDAFIAKVDKTGANILYAKTYGAAGSTLSASRVAVDSGGNAVFLGTFTGTVNFGFGGPTTANAAVDDAYLLRVSSTGTSAWLKTFGNGKKITFNDVKVDPVGNAVLVGSFQGAITIGSKMLTVPGAGAQSNPFVAQLAVGGTTNWAVQLGNSVASGAGSTGVNTVGLDAGGNVMLAGICYGSFDLGLSLVCGATGGPYLAKLDSAGAPLWGKAYTGGGLAVPAFTTAPFAMISGSSTGALDLGKGAIGAGMVVTRIATK